MEGVVDAVRERGEDPQQSGMAGDGQGGQQVKDKFLGGNEGAVTSRGRRRLSCHKDVTEISRWRERRRKRRNNNNNIYTVCCYDLPLVDASPVSATTRGMAITTTS